MVSGYNNGRKRVMKLRMVLAAALVFCTLAPMAMAQVGGPFDHLKCYRITFKKGALAVDGHALDSLVLTPFQVPPFKIEEGCRLQPAKKPRPIMFCVPVDKQPRQNPTGTKLQNDYLVYQIRCPSEPDLQQGVKDQFVRGIADIHRKPTTRLLLVPAYKIDTPPPPCEPTAPHICGGTCPNSGDECRPGPTDICGCFPPSQPCGLVPGTNQCSGDCPSAGEICWTFTDPAGGVACDCVAG